MTRVRLLCDPDRLPALDPAYVISRPALGLGDDQPSPRILLLYGSLRDRSFSRFAVEEAARLLQLFGAETRIFDPSDLPLPDQVKGDDHPAVHELRELSLRSEGQVWCSPERHGAISGIMKATRSRRCRATGSMISGRKPTSGSPPRRGLERVEKGLSSRHPIHGRRSWALLQPSGMATIVLARRQKEGNQGSFHPACRHTNRKARRLTTLQFRPIAASWQRRSCFPTVRPFIFDSGQDAAFCAGATGNYAR